ncbi:hypothetical protein [Klebsiella michiganensis]|uniref:hypothetical protein n=1 Tax=Klebsiella michiganensis TaxID=1134687 RepID=UPI00292FA265|nr:hypothetical protein [Klebsiella michiganensis]
MTLLKTTDYKGITIVNALYTIETITIQGGQLDFYVSMRSKAGAPPLDGENHGCSYSESAGTPHEQAYAYLKTLEKFSDAIES